MSDHSTTLQYVKLGKVQQAPAEEIEPGELNQPISVPQLEVHRCLECGQRLPENYEPPADEPWTTKILDCMGDAESCWKGLLCPCVIFGQNSENIKDGMRWTTACVCHAIFVEGGIALGATMPIFYGFDPQISCLIVEGLLFTWWMCAVYTATLRQTLQRKYHLQNTPCDPCMVHCCLHWCAICQEHRELKGRLSDNIELPSMAKPPARQVMSMDERQEEEAAAVSGSSSAQQKQI